MITGIESIKSVFEKVIVDCDLQMKDLDTVAFTQWAAEAIEHIGAFHRWCPFNVVRNEEGGDDIEIVDSRIILPDFIIHIDEVLYAPSITEEFKPATRTRKEFSEANKLDDPTVFDITYAGGDAEMSFNVAIYFNKPTGFARIKTQMLPVATNEDGDPELLVPSLASYKEAVYWYIVYKICWREVFRGKNKNSQQQYAAGMWHNMKNLAYGELMMPENDEIDALAQELSLGISYTGLSKNKVWRDFYGKFADKLVLKGYYI